LRTYLVMLFWSVVFAIVLGGISWVAIGWTGGQINEFQHPPAPTCDGKPMSPGDQCQTAGPINGVGSGSSWRSYDQAQGEDHIFSLIRVVIGAAIAAVGGALAFICLLVGLVPRLGRTRAT